MLKSPKNFRNYLVASKKSWRFCHIFLAFSEYMNFTILTLEPKAFKMVAKENSVSSVELSYDWFKDEQFIF